MMHDRSLVDRFVLWILNGSKRTALELLLSYFGLVLMQFAVLKILVDPNAYLGPVVALSAGLYLINWFNVKDWTIGLVIVVIFVMFGTFLSYSLIKNGGISSETIPKVFFFAFVALIPLKFFRKFIINGGIFDGQGKPRKLNKTT